MPSALASVMGEKTRFWPGFCAHQARRTARPNPVSAAASGWGLTAGSAVATPRTMTASTAGVAAGADPQPTTAAAVQAAASSRSEVPVRCLMPLGRPPLLIGSATFIPESPRAGPYDIKAAYKFPCENPPQAFSSSPDDRSGDGGRTGHGGGARPARRRPARP